MMDAINRNLVGRVLFQGPADPYPTGVVHCVEIHPEDLRDLMKEKAGSGGLFRTENVPPALVNIVIGTVRLSPGEVPFTELVKPCIRNADLLVRPVQIGNTLRFDTFRFIEH
jgi:hypothetical protein